MPVPFFPLRAQTRWPQGRPKETTVKTLWDKPIRNVNGAWLTKPDSEPQPPTGQFRPNRRKMLPGSGFLATLWFMSHFKSREQPTRETHPFDPVGVSNA